MKAPFELRGPNCPLVDFKRTSLFNRAGYPTCNWISGRKTQWGSVSWGAELAPQSAIKITEVVCVRLLQGGLGDRLDMLKSRSSTNQAPSERQQTWACSLFLFGLCEAARCSFSPGPPLKLIPFRLVQS